MYIFFHFSVLKIKFYSTRKILWGKPDLTRQNIFVGWYLVPDKSENHSINQDYFYTSLSLLSVWRGCKPPAYILFVCLWLQKFRIFLVRELPGMPHQEVLRNISFIFFFTSVYCVFFTTQNMQKIKNFNPKNSFEIFLIFKLRIYFMYMFFISSPSSLR